MQASRTIAVSAPAANPNAVVAPPAPVQVNSDSDPTQDRVVAVVRKVTLDYLAVVGPFPDSKLNVDIATRLVAVEPTLHLRDVTRLFEDRTSDASKKMTAAVRDGRSEVVKKLKEIVVDDGVNVPGGGGIVDEAERDRDADADVDDLLAVLHSPVNKNRVLAVASAVAEHLAAAIGKPAATVYTDILNGNPHPVVRLFLWQHLQQAVPFLRRNFEAGAVTVVPEWDAYLCVIFGTFAVSSSALEDRALRHVMVNKYVEKLAELNPLLMRTAAVEYARKSSKPKLIQSLAAVKLMRQANMTAFSTAMRADAAAQAEVADQRAQQKAARIDALRAKRAQEASAKLVHEKENGRAGAQAAKQAKKQRIQNSAAADEAVRATAFVLAQRPQLMSAMDRGGRARRIGFTSQQ